MVDEVVATISMGEVNSCNLREIMHSKFFIELGHWLR
jgi:hypothetical protein